MLHTARQYDKNHPWCRVCLVSNVKMCRVENIQLLQIYEKLTNTKLNNNDRKFDVICYICYFQLQRIRKFSDMAHKSQKILEDLHRQGVKVQEIAILPNFGIAYNLNVTIIPSMSVPSSQENTQELPQTVVNEEIIIKEETIKLEADTVLNENTENIDQFEEPIIETSAIMVNKITDVSENTDNPLNFGDYKKSQSVQGITKNHHEITKDINEEGDENLMKNTFFCKTCKIKFTHKHLLQIHMQSHTGEKLHICNTCNMTFSCSTNLQNHVRKHTGEKPFSCDTCNKAFSLKGSLLVHIRSHTRERPYSCKYCNNKYKQSCHLSRHIILNHTHNTYIKSHNMLVHMEPHKQIKYSCSLCKKFFIDESKFTAHLRTHTGEKPYACSECSIAFYTCSNLQRHMRSHTGEKPHTCEICTKTFTSAYGLKRHMIIHTGEKPYVCNICQKTFSGSFNLQRHKKLHTGEKLLQCNDCNKLFTDKTYLIKHLRNHSGERYACKMCPKTFMQRNSLQKHLRLHSRDKFQCNLCNKLFTEKRFISQHMSSKHTQLKKAERMTYVQKEILPQ